MIFNLRKPDIGPHFVGAFPWFDRFPDDLLTAVLYKLTMEAPLIYRSYLLRLWQVREADGLAWRASLEEVKTGEQRGFTSLEDLIAYLQYTTESGIGEAEDRLENGS